MRSCTLTGAVVFGPRKNLLSLHGVIGIRSQSNLSERETVQARFHADPRIARSISWLCERIPITRRGAEEVFRGPKTTAPVSVQERIWTSKTPLPMCTSTLTALSLDSEQQCRWL